MLVQNQEVGVAGLAPVTGPVLEVDLQLVGTCRRRGFFSFNSKSSTYSQTKFGLLPYDSIACKMSSLQKENEAGGGGGGG